MTYFEIVPFREPWSIAVLLTGPPVVWQGKVKVKVKVKASPDPMRRKVSIKLRNAVTTSPFGLDLL
jgi:hypothetical protein